MGLGRDAEGKNNKFILDVLAEMYDFRWKVDNVSIEVGSYGTAEVYFDLVAYKDTKEPVQVKGFHQTVGKEGTVNVDLWMAVELMEKMFAERWLDERVKIFDVDET